MKEEIKEFGYITKCCGVESDCGGGGYDGEKICPISCWCPKCGKLEPKMKQNRRGRPPKIEIPF